MMTISTRKRTCFGNWNIRTMLKNTTQAQLCKEFRRYKLDILGLSEIRKADSGELRTSTGEHLLFSGKPESDVRSSGVGFLLSRTANNGLLDWKPISDRLITARFKASPKNVTFVQAYAPTMQADPVEKDDFYSLLAFTLDRIPKADIKVLMGDFNAKVGSDNTSWESAMGSHGIGVMNENGRLFADLCIRSELVIGGTLFPHKDIHKITWVSSDHRTQNQIDHIAISKKWRSSLQDVRNKRGADVFSDHHLLIGCIRLKMLGLRRPPVRIARKMDVAKLKEESTRQRFMERMRNRSEIFAEEGNAESKWNIIRSAFISIGEDVLGFRDYEKKEWILDRTWALINERRMMKNRLNIAPPEERSEVMRMYSETNRKVGRSARADKRRWLSRVADSAQQAADSNNMRETYRISKRLTSSLGPAVHHPVKSSTGEVLTTEDAQMERWSEYFEDILNKQPPMIPRSPTGDPVQRNFNIEPPSIREIAKAINRLKNNKSPGADNIASELLKIDAIATAEHLKSIIDEVWASEDTPNDWKDGVIIKLPKKGNLRECTNWRGITLLNTVNKVLSIILHGRLSDTLDSTLRREQAGFRHGNSCTDHTNTLRIIVEQSMEWQTPLVMLFIDFERAFDSIDRGMMWQILTSYGVPDKLLHIIQSMYRNANCRVIHRGAVGREFRVASGVKQGCILSPLLFLLVLDWVMKKTNNAPRGILWNTMTMTRLEDLAFADDICLMANSRQGMEQKLERLVAYGKQVGLKVNVGKTKLMRVNLPSGQFPALSIDGEQIKEVEEFCYLGSIIAKDGGADLCVANRILKARQAFAALNKFWRSPQISRNLKMRFFRTNCMSVLLYGCETWKTTPSIISSLQVFVNNCLRRILRIHWPETIRNEDLWSLTHAEKVEVTITRRKWSWIGHTLRRHHCIAKEALDWNPQGARKRGRPKETWRRVIMKEIAALNTTWAQVKATAINRVRWKAFVSALCSHAE